MMHSVIDVKVLEHFKLQIQFEDATIHQVDCSPLIKEGTSAPLSDKSFFERVAIEPGGGLEWPNGFDLCPNFLYDLK